MTQVRQVVVRLPLRLPLFGSDSYGAVLFQGPAGWGECSLLPGLPLDAGGRERCWRAAEAAATAPWPQPARPAVPVNALVPAVGARQAAALTAEAVAAGVSTVKVKVGQDPFGADLDRVAAVREALGPAGRPVPDPALLDAYRVA